MVPEGLPEHRNLIVRLIIYQAIVNLLQPRLLLAL